MECQDPGLAERRETCGDRDDPRQVVKIKALGFMGIMVQGAHHQIIT